MNAMINFEELFAQQAHNIQVKGEGVVTSILNDDLKGRRHQRFVLELAQHKTLLILNNIDEFPRLAPLSIGDRVEFHGKYIWNRHGGAVHWTHGDPQGKHESGYVKVVADASAASGLPIPLGTYRHYKGNLYQLTGFATHSETLEDMVIYKALQNGGKTWVRPLSMWEDIVETGGKPVKRFSAIK